MIRKIINRPMPEEIERIGILVLKGDIPHTKRVGQYQQEGAKG